jgi:tetratricopeptide (TPR) repeat protein/Mrp family chromosome partitioning ATPase
MAMSRQTNLGTIVTFYSWKGGVGRTMALANIAVQLARAGSRVLMVDWDLEAPGLDRYFIASDQQKNTRIIARQPVDRGGLMRLLDEAFNYRSDRPKIEDWQKKLIDISVARSDSLSSTPDSFKFGKLDLLASGQGDINYSEKLSTFSWENFFSEARGGEWLEALREQWKLSYDYVFLDSRTGLSDSGGVCTVQMPDILLLVFTANDQSLEGGLRVVQAVQKERANYGYDRSPLAVIPLLSRWEGENEVDIGKEWMRRFNIELSPLTQAWLPKLFSPRQFLEKTRIPHVARFTFGEPLPVLTHSITDPGLPGIYFDTIARLLRSNLADAGKIIDANYNFEAIQAYGTKIVVLPYPSLGALFKGRDEFMLRVGDSLSHGRGNAITIHAIYGLGGVGKTRAAVEYAWAHQEDYSALLFVNGDTPEALRRGLAGLASTLVPAIETPDDEVKLACVMDWLKTNRGWLLILDSVDNQLALAEVDRLLSRLSNGHVLITSRLANFSAYVEPLGLDVLHLNDATAFLLDRSRGRRRAAPDDEGKARELAIELGQLALALEQAGAYISSHRLTFGQYFEKWKSERDEVLAWFDPTVTGYPRAIAVTWQTSVAELSGAARHLLERLAWFAPEKIPESLLDVKIIDSEPESLREHFDELTNYSLATREAEGPYFLIHRLVQEITRRSLTDAARRQSLVQALTWINRAFPFESDDVRYWPQADALAPHARAVVMHADAAGIFEPTTRLMNQLGLYLSAKALFVEAESLYRRALAIDESRLGRDHDDIAVGLNNLGVVLQRTNRLVEAEALLRRAVTIAEKTSGTDSTNVAGRLSNLAHLLQETNRHAEAESLVRRALEIDEKSLGPEDPHIAVRLCNLAQLLHDTNRLVEAEPLMRRALAIDEKVFGPDHPNVATDLSNLSLLLLDTNRLAEAEPLIRRALAIDEKSLGPDHPDVAIRLNNLAHLLRITNRLLEAEPLMRRALDIDERRFGPDHPRVAARLNNLAELLEATDRPEDAELLHRRARAIDELRQATRS